MLKLRLAAAKRARFGVLLLPALLGGCYVVPIVPFGPPVYRQHRGPYQGPYRGYYRYGQADAPPANAQQAGATLGEPQVEVASTSR